MAPISARKIRTNMYGWVISFISWLFALAFSAQALFLRKTITYVHNSTYIAQLEEHICLTTQQNQSSCEVRIPEPEVFYDYEMCVWDYRTEQMSVFFMLVKLIAGFLLPLGIISIAYTFIFIRTRRLQMGERGDRVNRMIILVVVSFFITWLPNQMITFYLVVTPDEQINASALYKISPFSQIFANSTLVINPLIYAFARDDLRTTARNLFNRKSTGLSNIAKCTTLVVDIVTLPETTGTLCRLLSMLR